MRLQRSLALFICLAASICLGMSNWNGNTEQNQQAKEWYKRGIAETSHQKRVPMFLKAIQFDPAFIDAYYQLGLSYKSLKNFTESEKALIKAYSVKPVKLTQEKKTNILFELGSVYLRLGRLTEAEGTLQSAKDAATDIGMKAKIAFELGRVFAAQSQYARALQEFNVAKILDPPNASRYDFFVRSMTDKLQVANVTQKAVVAKSEPPQKSDDVQSQSTEVASIENHSRAKTEDIVSQALYDQARKYESEGNLDFAVSAYQNLRSKAPGFRDVVQRLAKVRRKIDKKRQQEIVETEYAAGMEALRSNNWLRAIYAFEKVMEHDRNYRDVWNRLGEAQKGLDQESADAVLSRYYAEGLLLMENDDYAGAYAIFEKVQKMDKNYRNVAFLIEEVRKKREEMMVVAAAEAKNAAIVDSLRRAAQTALLQEDWARAVSSLDHLRPMVPGDDEVIRQYMHAQMQLSDSNAAIAASQKTEGRRNYVVIGSAIAGFFLLLMVGIFRFRSAAQTKKVQIHRSNHTHNSFDL